MEFLGSVAFVLWPLHSLWWGSQHLVEDRSALTCLDCLLACNKIGVFVGFSQCLKEFGPDRAVDPLQLAPLTGLGSSSALAVPND